MTRLRHDTTIALEQAIDAAKTYDGTEPAYNHLVQLRLLHSEQLRRRDW